MKVLSTQEEVDNHVSKYGPCFGGRLVVVSDLRFPDNSTFKGPILFSGYNHFGANTTFTGEVSLGSGNSFKDNTVFNGTTVLGNHNLFLGKVTHRPYAFLYLGRNNTFDGPGTFYSPVSAGDGNEFAEGTKFLQASSFGEHNFFAPLTEFAPDTYFNVQQPKPNAQTPL